MAIRFSELDDDHLLDSLTKAKARKAHRLSDEQRLERLQHMAESEGSFSRLGMERVLGKNDLFYLNYLERGLMAARPVARISLVSTFDRASYGTGFMVSPRLMLTNNHVLKDDEAARSAFCEFRYEIDSTRRPMRPARFDFEPTDSFTTDEDLDYTLVAVSPNSDDGQHSLDEFGFLRLGARSNKIIEGEYVSIVQHPNGDYKKVALRENQVIKYGGSGSLNSFLWYYCDTAPGSSGSPVFNDSWQVAALHHAGVPDRTIEDGTTKYRTHSAGYLTEDEIIARNLAHDIVWLANEGVRISRIVQDVSNKHAEGSLGQAIAELLDDALELSPFRDVTPGVSVVGPSIGETMSHDEDVRIPDREEPDLGSADRGQKSCRHRTRRYYRNRRGYDSDFLGVSIPLPDLTRQAHLHGRPAVVDGRDDYELRYHHFSIVMNADRRLAFFAAVNIDGGRSVAIEREGRDVWCFDPRLNRSDQVGNELYASEIWYDRRSRRRNNWFDRGHLVRRLDPVWGRKADAVEAEIDTFQWTNCAPQYFTFNQEWWLGLEKYVLNNVDNDDLRASVFNGPVFSDDDEEHRGIRIPQYYWKLVVVRTRRGDILSSAFILDQRRYARDLPFELAPVEDYGGYQTSVEKLEAKTGLRFGSTVRESDVRSGLSHEDLGIRDIADIELTTA